MAPPLSLFQPDIYLAQLSRLRAKFGTRRRSREPQSEGLSLSELHERGDRLCEHIASEVQCGAFRFSPLERVLVFADGKRRTIHRATLVDSIVLGALSQCLTALLEPVLDDNVHAYRPGRNPQRTIERLCVYLAEHRRTRPEPRERGLFVLQRDLAAYGESIPTGPDSELWPLLDSVVGTMTDRAEARMLRSLVAAGCRPEVHLPTGELTTMTHGLPTGSPIQQPLANLYLSPLDERLRTLGVTFYARFGDDLLVVEPQLAAAHRVASALDEVVKDLGLVLNPDKTRNLYFTGPGRPLDRASIAASRVTFAPTSHLEYLGVRLSFFGHRGLKRKRLRQLLSRSRLRVENTVRVAPSDRTLEFVAAALGNALHGTDSAADPATTALRTWVDDRQQLRQLDHQLTLLCAEAISRRRGVRAFRHTRPQQLRHSGLRSLLELRRRSRGTP